ncbi:MAG: polymer-forming cytoskeletal protein [Bdellovibrionales bacterium]|nr:polymer-forming cytoskeletal protein [Bdellovibrionales bacterium]
MSDSPNVLVGKECRISGRLSLTGQAVIDGAVDGEIVATGELTVGQTGVVDAKIVGERIHVYGRVVGEIECSEKLFLHAGARVYGNLRCPAVVMEDGVSFEGHCSMETAADEGKQLPQSAQTRVEKLRVEGGAKTSLGEERRSGSSTAGTGQRLRS